MSSSIIRSSRSLKTTIRITYKVTIDSRFDNQCYTTLLENINVTIIMKDLLEMIIVNFIKYFLEERDTVKGEIKIISIGKINIKEQQYIPMNNTLLSFINEIKRVHNREILYKQKLNKKRLC
jgi:hypothetical protein